jgi:hypothetical protein
MRELVIPGFSGKKLNQNLANMGTADLLQADNVQILSDGVIRTVPGYTLVHAFGAGPTNKIYDFQRAVDHKQFTMVQHGGTLDAIYPDGSVHTLSTGETSEPYSFVQNAFVLYGSNGVNAWRFVDAGDGNLTKYQWGITPPSTAPAVSVGSASSLSLIYGRQYVYCYVSEITDSLGVVRTSVSAPSPMSAFSGPTSSHAVNLTSITASTDPQVNKIWIFETFDAAVSTQSTFYFAAEISNGTTSFADTLADNSLDQTRQAPFNTNLPPPACSRLVSFASRIWALTDNFIQSSGGENVLLGIPEEGWNPQDFISVPSGSRIVVGGITIDNGSVMMVGTPEWYMSVQVDTTNSATTINQQDRTVTPGLAGKQGLVQIPGRLLWIAPDKRLWSWSGGSEAGNFSDDIGLTVAGTKSVNELSAAALSTAEIRYFTYGQQHYVLVAANTGTGHLDWIALYELITSVNQYSGNLSISGSISTDMFPTAPISATANVLVGNVPYVYLGDTAGNVYRWPDGFSGNGATIFSTGWLHDDLETVQEWAYVDFTVDDLTAFNRATIAAVAMDQPDMTKPLILVQARPYPFTHANGDRIIRVPIRQVKGASVGKYLRLQVQLPADGSQHSVVKASVAYKPLFRGSM